MPSFANDDDDDFNIGSPNGSSDNEQDETMEDADELDGDGDAEADEEQDADGDGEDDMDENEDEDENDENQDASPSKAQQNATGPKGDNTKSPVINGAQRNSEDRDESKTTIMSANSQLVVRPEAISASLYDIVPTIAAPHSTSINTLASTPDLKWVFSGGSDGYIRKFNWVDTINGKVMLTVAQRHPFVDSVTKAGVLMSYWENDEPLVKSPLVPSNDEGLSLSPVYSLAVQSQGLWLLSGLESGGINLQSVRHDEGKRITCLRQHTSTVSVLSLSSDERSLLSGSWDRSILDWDLDSGKVKRSFISSGGQISAIEPRPLSDVPIPSDIDMITSNGDTFSSNNAKVITSNDTTMTGVNGNDNTKTNIDGMDDAQGSPTDSLFGGKDDDSLFGDNEDTAGLDGPSDNVFDYDNDISRAIESERREQDALDAGESATTADKAGAKASEHTATENISEAAANARHQLDQDSSAAQHQANGQPRVAADGDQNVGRSMQSEPAKAEPLQTSTTTFVAASMDGTIRLWDRRQSDPVATISPPKNVPPWCMNACWSPDGNFIYAGRRNGTVEEYNLHKGLRQPDRTFKFPLGSGPVSALKAMPNGRHLVCASFDILRLYDLKDQQAFKHSTVPFLIVPGHRGGVISSLYIDPTCTYLLSAAGNRGWEGSTTEVLLGYEIGLTQ